MPRRGRSDLSEIRQSAKRRRGNCTNYGLSDTTNLWNASDDSLFASSKIIELFSSEGNSFLTKSKNDAKSLHNASDDSLFGDIFIPESSSSESNVGATPIQLDVPSASSSVSIDVADDTLFRDLDLNELTGENDEKDTVAPAQENVIQCTQQFLDDVAVFKTPLPKQSERTHKPEATATMSSSAITHCQLSTSMLMPGTQYETHDELLNRTIRPSAACSKVEKNLGNEANKIIMSDITLKNWDNAPHFTQLHIWDFPSKGDFYGLPDKVKRMIFEHKGIKSLYEWQDECLNLPAIGKRQNLIYALPTSGGKTLVAEILMLREVICRQKNVLFILPYVSIVQEKVCALAPFAIECDFFVDEYTAGRGKCPPLARKKRKSIYVASIEKGAVLFDSLIDAKRANEIGLVVVDELHLIGEKGRGATLEALLTKVMFVEAGIQIVGMSATIGNLSEISTFLKADVYTRAFRPVELKEYIKCGNDILQINSGGQSFEEIFVFQRKVDFKYSDSVAKADPDHLAGLVTECAPQNCCLIFCPTRKNCESVAVLLSKILPKAKFFEHRKSEKLDLMDALDKVCGVLSPILAKTIPFGIAYHHSGLTTDERRFIETAYRFGVLSVICCTSTLAAGVNLPAKRVIIRSPYVGREFMTLCKYKQMIGRAGRAGITDEAGESILIAPARDNVRVGEMLFSPMDKALSSLNENEGIGLQTLILSAIGLELANCRQDLYRLIDSTLLAAQQEQLEINPHNSAMLVLRQMFKNKVLQICKGSSKSLNSTEIMTSQDNLNMSIVAKSQQRTQNKRVPLLIGRSTKFELTEIGRAAFKAGIDYKRTYSIYSEIKSAQKQLILTSFAHLLYLVVCFFTNGNGDEMFAANAAILVKMQPNLDAPIQALLVQLGLTEAHLAKIARTLSIQGAFELKLNRVFKMLVLMDVLDVVPIPTVAAKFDIERGILQNMVSQAAASASALVRLCEQVPEFWCFQPLFERLITKIDRCGTAELEPLLDLPAVKINRAKQLYAAGFQTIEDIAKTRPMNLVKSVEHMPLRVAKEIISAAKIILMKKLDHLEEETEALKDCLRRDDNSAND